MSNLDDGEWQSVDGARTVSFYRGACRWGELGSEAPNQDLQLSDGERPAKSCLGDAPFGLRSVGACSAI